jgi:hypothetical protein
MKITKGRCLNMLEKIRFEWFIIKEVYNTIWWNVKVTKSLGPVLDIFNPNAVFKIRKNGPWIKGGYYTYIKNRYIA